MLTQLKFSASEQNLFLNPETISCEVEKGAIKALKFNFPSVKINGCHFHSFLIYSRIKY